VRIAVVTTSWPRFEGDPSGHFVEAETRALTQCSEAGTRPEVVVIRAAGDAFGWPGIAARVKESPLRIAGAVAWVVRARAEVAGGEFDEVVAHWAVPCAWPISMTEGPRLTVISHGGDVRLLARLPGPLRAQIVTRIADRASVWRFVSTHLLTSLVSVLSREAGRRVERVARIAPCMIEVPTPGEEALAEKRAEMGTPFAVCVARLVASKRVEAAIAWAEAEGRALVIVGDGPERARLERMARANRQKVHFAGRTTRPDALAWIASSSELVQASREEGLSTVVREAEQLGVRVVEL
jgi:teichuronic acid biosynthesis glycosyltransferase TuaC